MGLCHHHHWRGVSAPPPTDAPVNLPPSPPGHPRFFNQLFSGLDHHALAGRLLTETLNTSQYVPGGAGGGLSPRGVFTPPHCAPRYTYEIAPVFVLMEEVVLSKLRELVGWNSGDGIFCPGEGGDCCGTPSTRHVLGASAADLVPG